MKASRHAPQFQFQFQFQLQLRPQLLPDQDHLRRSRVHTMRSRSAVGESRFFLDRTYLVNRTSPADHAMAVSMRKTSSLPNENANANGIAVFVAVTKTIHLAVVALQASKPAPALTTAAVTNSTSLKKLTTTTPAPSSAPTSAKATTAPTETGRSSMFPRAPNAYKWRVLAAPRKRLRGSATMASDGVNSSRKMKNTVVSVVEGN